MNAGPQERLRATEAARRSIQAVAQVAEIGRGAVGEFPVGLRPHAFGGIELRDVRGEVVTIEPRMVGLERAVFAPPMDRPAIPEQGDRAPEMAQQVLEKGPDIQPAEIALAAPQVQCQAPAFRGDPYATADQ